MWLFHKLYIALFQVPESFCLSRLFWSVVLINLCFQLPQNVTWTYKITCVIRHGVRLAEHGVPPFFFHFWSIIILNKLAKFETNLVLCSIWWNYRNKCKLIRTFSSKLQWQFQIICLIICLASSGSAWRICHNWISRQQQLFANNYI